MNITYHVPFHITLKEKEVPFTNLVKVIIYIYFSITKKIKSEKVICVSYKSRYYKINYDISYILITATTMDWKMFNATINCDKFK